jgi:DNA-binding NarL/FixJ family response regulator
VCQNEGIKKTIMAMPPKTERNKRIMKMHANGKSLRQIAQKEKLSHITVREIIIREKERDQKKA